MMLLVSQSESSVESSSESRKPSVQEVSNIRLCTLLIPKGA